MEHRWSFGKCCFFVDQTLSILLIDQTVAMVCDRSESNKQPVFGGATGCLSMKLAQVPAFQSHFFTHSPASLPKRRSLELLGISLVISRMRARTDQVDSFRNFVFSEPRARPSKSNFSIRLDVFLPVEWAVSPQSATIGIVQAPVPRMASDRQET